MSTAHPTNTSGITSTCNFGDCDAEYQLEDGYNDAMCSETCHLRDLGQRIINHLTHRDHRYCATSYFKIKAISAPGRRANSSEVVSATSDPSEDDYAFMRNSVPEFATGQQYQTPNSREAQVTVNNTPGRETVRTTGYGSPAGTSQGTIDRPNSIENALEYAANLSQAVRDLLREKEHDKQHDPEVLKKEILRKRLRKGPKAKITQADFERALGKAIAEWSP